MKGLFTCPIYWKLDVATLTKNYGK